MFDCDDVVALLAKLEAMGVRPHVSGPDTLSPQVFVSDYRLPKIEASEGKRLSIYDAI
jgi:hypothetical protein